jgi:hypothetical protein
MKRVFDKNEYVWLDGVIISVLTPHPSPLPVEGRGCVPWVGGEVLAAYADCDSGTVVAAGFVRERAAARPYQ